jgi:hypothetical protein
MNLLGGTISPHFSSLLVYAKPGVRVTPGACAGALVFRLGCFPRGPRLSQQEGDGGAALRLVQVSASVIIKKTSNMLPVVVMIVFLKKIE